MNYRLHEAVIKAEVMSICSVFEGSMSVSKYRQPLSPGFKKMLSFVIFLRYYNASILLYS